MGGVSEAVARAARAGGADIRTSAAVAGVDVAGGRVRGVTLESGERLEAPIVASGIHPRTLVLDLVGRGHWPGEVVRDMERFRTRGGAVKINMVVSELPQWRGIEGEDLERVWRDGDFAVCPSIEHLERSWQQASLGEMPPECGYIEVLTPSAGDPTLVDEGLPGHVMTLYTQFGPPEREAWTDATRDAYAAGGDGAAAHGRPEHGRLGRHAPRGAGAARPGGRVRPRRRQHLPRRAGPEPARPDAPDAGPGPLRDPDRGPLPVRVRDRTRAAG